MVLSKEELKLRKEQVLGITVSQYIKTVNPVSSSYIAESSMLDLSSASVRNILADLEKEGYLTHPHTSAGRIPTEAGYRYYVDNLMMEIQLLEEEKRRIKREYLKQRLVLEELLDQTSRMLSATTQYIGIVSLDGWSNKFISTGTSNVAQYPDYQDIEKIHNLLKILDEKEQILEVINQELKQKIDIYIGHEMIYKQMQDCALVVSTFETKSGPAGRIAVLGPQRMEYERVVSALDYLRELISDIEV